ncbi:MAG: 4Fe-4S dicluster domain-containing protein [Candidatus Sulfotelmatobacter sp.]
MLSVWSETASSVPQPVDFGWRLHGRTVYLLHDSSLTLLPHRQRATAALLAQYCPDANSLLSCLQCGACTVNCHLAETNGASFPRRQMTLLQLGEVDRLVTDPSVWLCFNCQDCTSRCPANAGPGRIMAAIRRLAVEHYSVPHWLSRSINQRRGFLRMLLAAITLVLLAIARGGSFSPQITPVRYASMFPHFALNLFFGTLAAMVTISAAVNTARAWKAFTGEAPAKTSLGRVLESLVFATRQIARHRQFSECQQFRLSRWAHIAVLYGFMTLLMLAGAAAAMIALGASYPLPVLHPFKIAGNLAAVLIIVGSLYFCVQRARLSQGREACAWFDWAPLVQLLLVSTTGLLAELFRYANLGRLAYPAYFLHLIFVFVLLAGFANSKLAHVFYRTIALTAEQYKTVSDASTADLRPRRMAA